MRFATVQGAVTLSRCLPSFNGASLRVATPLMLDELRAAAQADGKQPPQPEGEELVVWDDLGAGVGSLIAFTEGGEASQPFRPDFKPVDAYCAAILDKLNLEGK